MTRSRRRPAARPRSSQVPDPPAAPDDGDARPRRRTVLVDLAIIVGALVVASVAAEIGGAANLGTALSFGQIAFALAALYVFMRR